MTVVQRLLWLVESTLPHKNMVSRQLLLVALCSMQYLCHSDKVVAADEGSAEPSECVVNKTDDKTVRRIGRTVCHWTISLLNPICGEIRAKIIQKCYQKQELISFFHCFQIQTLCIYCHIQWVSKSQRGVLYLEGHLQRQHKIQTMILSIQTQKSRSHHTIKEEPQGMCVMMLWSSDNLSSSLAGMTHPYQDSPIDS